MKQCLDEMVQLVTEDGPGSRYGFIYKGKKEAVLTEIQNIPRNYSYFLHSDRDMIGESWKM